ncbi:MAG TPA: RdgB/HAM1 family non-canonical purine NTP pyrophosphatase [Pyrinomonadaceae bacterium]|nr:RdgB/HAM1 family non-canonical purine NTP pyrophosphatase [Pyrinomonadaceae bacterium]
MNNDPRSIVLATGNAGKVRELRELFREVQLELKSLQDFIGIVDVEETGATFEENAILKARGFALQTSHMALADDSGLEVEALANEPGVRSARFAGADTGYDVKIPKLLGMINAAGDRNRRARFVCVMAVADRSGEVLRTVRGECWGTIADKPKGWGGFGYDPIFIPDGYDQTFGELSEDVKQQVSHRARAAELLIRYLLDFTRSLT